MLNWNPLSGSRREQPKARRRKESVQLRLEVLENRIVPSASPENPLAVVTVASPPPLPPVAAINSFLFSQASHEIQAIYTLEQDIISEVKTLDQELFQAVAALEQKWLNLFGISFTASNQAPSNFVMQPADNPGGVAKGSSSGSGSGSGAATTHHNPDQQIHRFAAQPGSGAGNGASPDSSSGSATVYGNVWLDNNGNGSIDHGEAGFQGAGVVLYTSAGAAAGITTTDANGNYSITIPMGQGQSGYYYIAVAMPQSDYPTIPGYSQINANGVSQQFLLGMGAAQLINAGIRSMNVTTAADDFAAAIPMQITLRDAIQTGNNGPPAPAVTFDAALNGKTISLKGALDAIKTSYNITGPGANPITVQGQGQANPYRIFTVNAGVTSTIGGLIIQGGYDTSGKGGGILNSGNLTLTADTIAGNQTTGTGGGIYNSSGAQLQLQSVTINNKNTAQEDGGGLENFGTVTISGTTTIDNNSASRDGGGIENGIRGTIKASGTTNITNNSATRDGGGVANPGTFTMKGGSINGNTAGQDGGGLYNTAGTLTLSAVKIQGNKATSLGGGLFVLAGKLTLKADTIGWDVNKVKNRAVSGGGIFISAGTVNITGGSIVGNSASASFQVGTINGEGGGIYNFTGSMTIQKGVNVTDNIAKVEGGGMYFGVNSTNTFGLLPPWDCALDGNSAFTGNGAYQQVIAGVPPKNVNQWTPGINVYDYDDTDPKRPGLPVQGP